MNQKRFRTSRHRAVRTALVMALGALALLAVPSLAAAKDRNTDRIPDRWEKAHHLSLKVKQTKRDQDRDGLKNLGEFNHGTNPRDADTDNDGLEDGTEVEVGDNPSNDDSDNDGVEDGDENAGTIASFDGTTLTINLAAGGSVSGQVTDATEIECDDQGDHSGNEHSGHDGSGHHSDSVGSGEDGSGDHQSGDDDSGDQSGDDDSGDDGDSGSSCTVDDLVPEAVVHEADLHIGGSGAVFEKVELEPATA
jgi:hypothetical protein